MNKKSQRIYVTAKETLRNLVLAESISVIVTEPELPKEAAIKTAIHVGNMAKIALTAIEYSIEYPGHGDESTYSFNNTLKPRHILNSLFEEYIEDKSWAKKEKLSQDALKIDFFHWLNCVKFSFAKIETGEKSYIKLAKIACGYQSVFDYMEDIVTIIQEYDKKINPPAKSFDIYNAEKFIEYIQKYSNEDKAKMLLVIAKFLGEEDLRTMLSLCNAYGMIHTVEGVTYPDGTHREVLDRVERLLHILPINMN